MNNNKKYFMEELGLKHDVFQPRPEAVAYKSQQDAEKAVLSFIEREFAQLEDSKEKVFILLHKYFSLETLRKRHELLSKAIFLFHKYCHILSLLGNTKRIECFSEKRFFLCALKLHS